MLDCYVVLFDIICDSDGKIDKFILEDGVVCVLFVYMLFEDKLYYMGVFFVGVY